jgi:DNA-binding response OmpR family regulator
MTSKPDTLPIILLIEQDDETRPLIKHNLHLNGYRAIVALDEEDAIERKWDECGHPALILLNQVNLSIDEFINMGRRIRQSAGFPIRTPIVVIAERFGADMEGKDVLVGESEYVIYPEDAQQLMDLLHRLCRNR